MSVMDASILIENAHDILAELQAELQMTAALATFADDGLHGVVVLSQCGGKGFSFTPQVGYEFPLHASGPGKALLSALSPEKREGVLGSIELSRYTEATITEAGELSDILREDSCRNYSRDHGELVVGINCVSAPVMGPDGQPAAAIWLTAPEVDLSEESFERIGLLVMQAARRIESRISGGTRLRGQYMKQVVRKARERMAVDLFDHMDMTGLAKELNVGYDWFRKKFKQETGESPTQYHTRLRIEKAQRLLTMTDLSVKEIALQLGYESQEYFSAFFKKKVGISPLHFREKKDLEPKRRN